MYGCGTEVVSCPVGLIRVVQNIIKTVIETIFGENKPLNRGLPLTFFIF
jgi:hypothetical protein